MNKSKIICISGQAESGKDTFANYIQLGLEDNNKKVLKVHYADLVKYICSNYLNWNGQKDESGRTLLQTFGTDIVRAHDKDYWVKFIANTLELTDKLIHYDYIIIPDCRFPNELDYWIDNDYQVTWIQMLRNIENHLTNKQKHHASEISLQGYSKITPVVIQNNSNMYDLEKKARLLVNVLLKLGE